MLERMSEDLGFGYRATKSGEVTLQRDGRTVTVLRGQTALEFLSDIEGASEHDQQQLMARLTGNYKHGNERLAAQHPRRRRG